jgi:hypothetical protein
MKIGVSQLMDEKGSLARSSNSYRRWFPWARVLQSQAWPCIRGYMSTAREHGINVLKSLRDGITGTLLNREKPTGHTTSVDNPSTV